MKKKLVVSPSSPHGPPIQGLHIAAVKCWPWRYTQPIWQQKKRSVEQIFGSHWNYDWPVDAAPELLLVFPSQLTWDRWAIFSCCKWYHFLDLILLQHRFAWILSSVSISCICSKSVLRTCVNYSYRVLIHAYGIEERDPQNSFCAGRCRQAPFPCGIFSISRQHLR